MTVIEIIQKLISSRKIDLNPPLPSSITWSDLGITDSTPITAIKLIQTHIASGHKIAIYGDYDVDGISATAILWQTIYSFYPHAFPHIPDRRTEGYGLSKQGIDHCLSQNAKLIITVDSGIVAFEPIAYAKSQGLDVIVLDHHEKTENLPPADVFIHSTATCAAGLSYFLAKDLNNNFQSSNQSNSHQLLELACLAVICDLVPLTGINRSLAKYGLEELSHTTRPGLLALYKESGLMTNPTTHNYTPISAYHVGFILGPRLNASGRLTHALDSLRLLCTNNQTKAAEYAKSLNETNLKRQQLTETLTQHAISNIDLALPSQIKSGTGGEVDNRVIVAADPSYDEGVIGLISARLVEKYYRPAITISVGQNISKASARSVPGFHITDFLRQFSDHFIGVGGHSMAAGFSFKTADLASVTQLLTSVKLSKDLLVKQNKFDIELNLADCSWDLWVEIQKLQPFGLGNSTPLFLAKGTRILHTRVFGKTSKHLSFTATQDGFSLPCVWFNPPVLEFKSESVNLYFSLDADTYRGPGNIQLNIKNIT